MPSEVVFVFQVPLGEHAPVQYADDDDRQFSVHDTTEGPRLYIRLGPEGPLAGRYQRVRV